MSTSMDSFTALAEPAKFSVATTPSGPHTLTTAFIPTEPCSDECQAVAEIFARHHEMVYRVCLRLLRHHHDAEDITQETFRRATIAIERWDTNRPIEPWLVSIASNRCRTFLAKKKRERLDTFGDEISPVSFDDGRLGIVEQMCLNEQIEGALDRLPERHRRAFELIHRHDRSYPEAADEMGHSVGTIKTWVHRARKAMQEWMQSDEASSVPSSVRKGCSTWTQIAKRTTAASVASFTGFLCWLAFSQASVPTVASAPDTSTHYQFESLQVFAQHTWTIEKIEQLPVTEWVTETSYVLEHIQEGVAPLGRTVMDIALLFASNAETTDALLIQPKANEETVPLDGLPSVIPTRSELSLHSDIQSIS